MNKQNQLKYNIFLQITKKLNEQEIIPVLYGSLGLNKAINKDFDVSDIDYLLPNKYLTDRWNLLLSIMNKSGYELIDEHEHEFEKDGIIIAFAKEEDLIEFSGVDYQKLNIIKDGNVKYRVLSPEEYLLAYRACLKDSYRQQKKHKNDREKIKLIEDFLKI